MAHRLLALLLPAVALSGCAPPLVAGDLPGVEAVPRVLELPDCPVHLEEPIPPAEDGWWVDVAVDVEQHAACAVDREGGLTCFGDEEVAAAYQVNWPGVPLESISIGEEVCGLAVGGEGLVCWGESAGDPATVWQPPRDAPFLSVVYNRVTNYFYYLYGDQCWVLDGYGSPLFCTEIAEGAIGGAIFSLHTSADVPAPVGVTRSGASSRYQTYFGFFISGATDIDHLHVADYKWLIMEFLVDCFLDRRRRPYCMLPVEMDLYSLHGGIYEEPGDVWRPSECRWQGLELVEDPDLGDGHSPALLGYRFDGTVEVYDPTVVAGPPLETLLPEGAYAKVVGHPSVVGCGITLEGELRCWDRDGVLDREVPGVP